MDKEEFLSFIKKKIEEIEKEKQFHEDMMEKYENNKGDSGYKENKFQFYLLVVQLQDLRDIIELPNYARIKAMSEIELEEQKKLEIETLELKIKELEKRKRLEEINIEKLKQEGTTPFINKYHNQLRDHEKALSEITIEHHTIIEQQQKVRAMTLQEFKSDLLSQITKKHPRLKETLKRLAIPINKSEELLTHALSLNKAQDMEDLYKRFLDLKEQLTSTSVEITLENNIPDDLKNKLKPFRNTPFRNTLKITNPDTTMKIIQEFKSSFEKDKAFFVEQFTHEALRRLTTDNTEIDIDFLSQHTDKINKSELDYLQDLIKERNKLSMNTLRFLKTSNTKHNLEYFNNRIIEQNRKIKDQIIEWYKNKLKSLSTILKTNETINFKDPTNLNNSLNDLSKIIANYEQAIAKLKEVIEKAKINIEQQKQDIEHKKQNVEQKIRTFEGAKYEETNIPYISIEYIQNAAASIRNKLIVNRILQEAQNQSIAKEAELRGITIKELLEIKSQEQSTTYLKEEVTSHKKR